jgi:hypothetical protein
MGTLETVRLGKELVPKEGPHPKTEIFDDPDFDPYSCIEVVGHDPHLPRYKTRVRQSMLSEPFERASGVKRKWRSPDFSEPWKHHNKNLKKIAEGAWEIPPESLRWACDDYFDQLNEVLQPYIREEPELCRKLTLDEAINGVAGSDFMGPLKMDTSAGIPNGKKIDSGLFIELPPYEDGRKRYKFAPHAQKYYDWMLKKFAQGEGVGVFARSCLKDEVVEEDSEKVRIFYILECIFGVLCRMYYLPICEFISRHPLESECMVGLNCAGPDWEKMVSHIEEHATDGRLIDWDFSGYDLKRSADVTCATLNVYGRIVENMGYSEDDMRNFHAIGEELRCPLMNWNGTLMFPFLWISGNNITVYGNGSDNSIHQRASFHYNGVRVLGDDFHKLGRYKDNEHVATYGDDGHGGSRPEVRDITNFSARKRYFDFINMGFTNARKDNEAQDDIAADEVDFLKRKSVYHPALGLRVGALATDSIERMGHMSHGKGVPEDLAIASIQTMLHESFLHGAEYYEQMRTWLTSAAQELEIWTKELECDFDGKILQWKEKYMQAEI